MKPSSTPRTRLLSRRRPAGLVALGFALLFIDTAAWAQDANVTRRVERLEKEMRAVQRQVFPGGSPAFFEPEIAPDSQAGARAGTAPNVPLANVNARVDSLESQLRMLTDQSEKNSFKINRMEQDFASFKAAVEARLTQLEAALASMKAVDAAPVGEVGASAPSASATAAPTVSAPRSAAPARATATPSPPQTAARPTAERLALVKAVEIPVTGNTADDAYSYGFRLWEAKLYPEAQAQLKTVIDKHGDHRLASFAGNLLGRAYLDENKPSLAAVAFYNNYKDRPNGERAPHSLMYMGIALDKLGRKADACKAFKELEDVYGDRAPASVRNEAATARGKAGC